MFRDPQFGCPILITPTDKLEPDEMEQSIICDPHKKYIHDELSQKFG